MDIFESPAVDVDEATVVNDIEPDESGSAAPAVAAGVTHTVLRPVLVHVGCRGGVSGRGGHELRAD